MQIIIEKLSRVSVKLYIMQQIILQQNEDQNRQTIPVSSTYQSTIKPLIKTSINLNRPAKYVNIQKRNRNTQPLLILQP